jgi:hypothetical protein
MKQIPLTKGKFALVDDEDYDFLMQWKWCYAGKYARRHSPRPTKKWIIMHKLINGTDDSLQTDHIDGNPMNNQRHNLRDATPLQNARNRPSYKNSFSKFKGVAKNKNKLKAYIRVEGKLIHLGCFSIDREIEAAKAYDAAALKYFGDFARLNFP